MNIQFNAEKGTFEIVDLTFEQFNHILNCIMFTADNGGQMPKPKKK